MASDTTGASRAPEGLRVGRLTKAHGLKGALKLELFTDAPEKRFVPGAVFALQVPAESPWFGKTLELNELRWYNSHPVGFFKGVDDRSAAETLVKAILWVESDGSEVSDEPDAWFDHQLVGLAVERDGVQVGTIDRLEHLPAQDLLVVKTDAGEVLVPFVSAIVPQVDLDLGVITVTPPTGLFEEIPEEDEHTANEPGVDEPGVDEHSVDEHSVDEPGVDEPGVDEHGAVEPREGEPADGDPLSPPAE